MRAHLVLDRRPHLRLRASAVILIAFAGLAVGAAALPATAAAQRPLAPSVDVTAESGRQVAGRVAAWQVSVGGQTVEHVAGVDAAGDLIVYTWSPSAGRWSAENVSVVTGRKVAGEVVAWARSSGPGAGEHLAGRSPSGRLLVFSRSAPAARWRVSDLTATTGVRLAGKPVAWRMSVGPFHLDHLAGRSSNGSLVGVVRTNGGSWRAYDVTAQTGRIVLSAPSVWLAGGRAHLAAAGPGGRIVEFVGTAWGDWTARSVPAVLPSGVTAWAAGSTERLAGTRADGALVVLTKTGSGWQAVNVTARTGERVTGTPAVYRLLDGLEYVDILGSMGPNGNVVVHWWKQSRDWQALDLTEITGRSVSSAPEAWTVRSGSRTIEHLAAVGSDGHLRVFYSYDQPRTLTDSVGAPFESIKRMRNTTRKVLVVLWSPRYPDNRPRPTRAEVAAALFGPGRSMATWYRENSGGAFSVESAGVFGWYDSSRPDSWYAQGRDRMGAALRAANHAVNYAAFDRNADGILAPNEVALVFAHPGPPGGLNRVGSRAIRDVNGERLVLDGVRIGVGVEVGIGSFGDLSLANYGIVTHELNHLLLGLPDMYVHTFRTPSAPGPFSIMDQHWQGFHLDAFNKLKLGWLKPRLVFRDARRVVPDVERSGRVLVLLDPSRPREYYVVENRWPGTSLDASLPDRGLGVWHVMEDRAAWMTAAPPPTVSRETWATLGGDWGRRAVRMIRPVFDPYGDSTGLWDGSSPATGYDLVSDDPDPTHASLRWGDGTPSGFALRSFGLAGASFPVTIETP